MKTIRDLNLENKKVLIRCDLNVPIIDGKITDNTRIIESLKTINYVLEHNGKVILLSHLGRVKEENDLKKTTLEPVAKELEKILNKKVIFIKETRGKNLEEAINKMKNKEIILMENTRYEDLDNKKESKNDNELGKYWASLGEVFINDAFGTLHREHASNVGIASNLPNNSGVGFLIEKELSKLKELKTPDHPFIVIMGGAKVSDKIGIIKSLVTKADKILTSGGIATTFLHALNYNVGKSLIDKNSLDFCKEILKNHSEKIVLPKDFRVSEDFSDESPSKIKNISNITDEEMTLDIGLETIENYKEILKPAKIVFWNGPLGVYEFSNYQNGTKEILTYLTNNNIKTILGGGDVVAASKVLGLKDKVYHPSTGGGATLSYLENENLPGLKIIK